MTAIATDLAGIESRVRRLVMGVAFAIVIATPILTVGLLKLLENTSKPLALEEKTITITPQTAPEADSDQEGPQTAPEAEAQNL